MLKSFAIEIRLRNQDCSEFMRMCHYHEWLVWRKYATEKQRDEALKALANREMWEYRKKDLK
ncbi:MAG: hypothetical protein UX75_C0037G0011 [Candidatus Moranbacteria bacterium GW2011_GWE2_47_10]|nr:MAG: hypothetical protein UX75_C0037G0011 [Candidatus Moranbacteria bacterium GW2011_GWE2_47_10]